MQRRRIFGAVAGAVAAGTFGPGIRAQTTRPPLTMVVPFAAGGQTDVIGRALANSMQQTLGRNVLVDNRPGAGGLLALRALQAAPADGHTVLLQNSGILVQPFIQKSAQYDVLKDVAPVALVGHSPAVLMVTDQVPANTLAEFIAWAKTQTKGIECANAGTNSAGHLFAMMLEKLAGIPLLHVAYKGTAQIATAMIGGEVRMQLSVMSDSLQPYVRSGKIQVLGVTSKERSALLPGVPAIGEAVPGYGFYAWLGTFAPAGTPRDRRDELSSAVRTALADPAVKARLESLYVAPQHLAPTEFAELIVRTRDATQHMVVDTLGVRPE